MPTRKGSLIVEEKGIDWTGGDARNEVFHVLYLGERPVTNHKGVEVVHDVVSQLQDYDLLGGKKLSAKESSQIATETGCVLVISNEKIRIMNKARKELLAQDSCGAVTFFTTLPGPPGSVYDTVAYITRNIRLNVIRCHVFTVNSGMGSVIAVKIQAAQHAYSQIAESQVGTPFFAPRDAPREVPKGRLFGMQIHRSDLKALEVIGAGQFGAVYLATQNMRRCPGCSKDYAIDGHLKRCLEKCAPHIAYDASKIVKHDVTRAVKMLKGVANAAAKKEFFDEANVMLMFDHPNVTNIMGVAVQQAPWLYVLEYAMYGDVRGVLKGCLQKRIVLHAGEMIHMCLGTSRGMEHLAELRLVHMDLAARNVLMGAGNLVKVADFGLTRELKPGSDTAVVKDKNIKLAIKWMAIEVLEKRIFSEQSDLWSAGITMWEYLSYGALPYKGKNNLETQKFIAAKGRMTRPKGCPESLWAVIEVCWAPRKEDRETFASLSAKLENLLSRNKPPSMRDIGAMLTDPAVEKRAKEEQKKADVERKRLVEAAMLRREELVEQAKAEKPLWYHPNVPKKIAEKQIKKNGKGVYLVREEKKDQKLLLLVNEEGECTAFSIKVEASQSRPGQFRYTFAGKPHTSLEHIIGNLKATPFRGRTGVAIQLTTPCPMKLKGGVVIKANQPPPGLDAGRSKENPMFNDD